MQKNQKIAIQNSDFDRQIRPQDDFYHYACGGWLKKNPIPKSEAQWGSFYELRDDNRKRIKFILEALQQKSKLKKDSVERKLRDFYLSGMDMEKINTLGLSALKKELAEISQIQNIHDLTKVLARFQRFGLGIFWDTFVSLDEKNSKKNIMYLYQPHLGLPEREYYLDRGKKYEETRNHYGVYIRKLLVLSGESTRLAEIHSKKILELETILAQASMSAEERRDVEKLYNKVTPKQLRGISPLIDWGFYFSTIGVHKVNSLIIGQPQYLKSLSEKITHIPIDEIKIYLTFRLLSYMSDMLPQSFGIATFNFYGKVLSGLRVMRPQWQRVYRTIDRTMGEGIGIAYVQQYFGQNAKKIMDEMIENLIEVFRERITHLDWMSAGTKKKALKKLGTFVSKIGYPLHPRTYKGLVIVPHEYLQNFLRASVWEFEHELAKLERTPDRNEWHIGAHVVNAFYWPNQNEIVFPAGILQPPFFDAEGDLALNYGAIGAVIGHELTHGFDDQGSLFDEKGNLKNWWSASDRELFKKKTNVLVKQYNEFVAIDELHINGKLTLGENIADLGGVILGYYALCRYMEKHGRLKDVSGFTPEQRYFLGNVLVERGQVRSEIARTLALSDPHSPSFARINGPLVHFDPFYKAFGIKKGDKMYRSSSMRTKIW